MPITHAPETGASFLAPVSGSCDDRVDWNSGVSVRTSTKSFSDFHIIWCVDRSRPHMRTSVTSTRSKVKVKVTELPKLRKLHFLDLPPPPFWRGAQNWWPYFGSTWGYSQMVGRTGKHYRYCACWCDLDPIQGQGQGHGAFELPKIVENCTILCLSPPPFWREAQNWWLTVIVWDLFYSWSEPDFRISF